MGRAETAHFHAGWDRRPLLRVLTEMNINHTRPFRCAKLTTRLVLTLRARGGFNNEAFDNTVRQIEIGKELNI